MSDFVLIIVAGGTGERAGAGLPKQYRPIGGVPVLRRTLEKFIGLEGLKDIRVVINPAHLDLYMNCIEGLDLPPPVIGGATRQESVKNGVNAFGLLHDKLPVLIHDAARPFIKPEIILACVEKLQTASAVSVAIPVSDTLRMGENNILGGAISRENLWAMQTPQGFHYGLIKKAHNTLSGVYTDDTQMVSELGIGVEIITGDLANFKITTEADFTRMQTFITRTGLGYDVHAFGDSAEVLRIGGIDVPHTHKLKGHSDADVVLHAITDAIYGTISSGDIGSHFPPSKSEFKNMDSAVFLKEAIKELQTEGGSIVHIDTVIICEDPKIGPHREKMRERIAEICTLPLKSISVKATTSEGLGFTGRREGIACQALVTARLPE